MDSMWKWMFDSEWMQRADINTLHQRSEAAADRMRRTEFNLKEQVRDLEGQVAGMGLMVRSLMTCLMESGALESSKFRDKLMELDLEDGKLDGR